MEAVPRLPLAMLARAQVLCRRGQHEDAFVLLSKTAGLRSDSLTSAMIQRTLAALHDLAGCTEQAKRHRAHARFLDPEQLVTDAFVPNLLAHQRCVSDTAVRPATAEVRTS
jgi:hypothetical protein